MATATLPLWRPMVDPGDDVHGEAGPGLSSLAGLLERVADAGFAADAQAVWYVLQELDRQGVAPLSLVVVRQRVVHEHLPLSVLSPVVTLGQSIWSTDAVRAHALLSNSDEPLLEWYPINNGVPSIQGWAPLAGGWHQDVPPADVWHRPGPANLIVNMMVGVWWTRSGNGERDRYLLSELVAAMRPTPPIYPSTGWTVRHLPNRGLSPDDVLEDRYCYAIASRYTSLRSAARDALNASAIWPRRAYVVTDARRRRGAMLRGAAQAVVCIGGRVVGGRRAAALGLIPS